MIEQKLRKRRVKQMKKKIFLFLLVMITLAFTFLPRLNKTHYGISEGIYYMDTAEEQPRPYICFTMNENGVKFVLGAENVSFSHHGEVVLDGKVNAAAKNGGTYVFEILDNDTISFCRQESTGEILELPEGAVFRYWGRESDRG